MVNLESKRLEDILKFLVGIFLILILNNLASRTFFRLDLTEENRFSLSPSTKELLRNLNEEAYIDVYLSGDLPAGMDRFQRAIRETLDEFRVYAGNNIQYNFIDPAQAAGSRARNEFMMSLAAKGIQPTNIFATENGKRVEKLIFPRAVISYAGQEEGVMLFKGNKAAAPQERLNQSIEGVEYELASAIQKMASFDLKTVAMIRGHQELDSIGLVSITRSLNEFYEVIPVDLPSTATLIGYDVILVAKPKTPFSEED
jgi:gliding-associated putative ABC transporter substrate-binding component GldG